MIKIKILVDRRIFHHNGVISTKIIGAVISTKNALHRNHTSSSDQRRDSFSAAPFLSLPRVPGAAPPPPLRCRSGAAKVARAGVWKCCKFL